MINIQESQKIYDQIKSKLKGQEGKIIALEPESRDYFLGNTSIEAYQLGKKKYPHRKFFFMRVGAKAAYHVGIKA